MHSCPVCRQLEFAKIMKTEQKSALPTPLVAKAGNPFVCTEVEIVTNRILLRPISEKYAQEIFLNFSSEVTRYMAPKSPYRIEDTLDIIRRSRDGMKRGDTLQFVIINKTSGEFLGGCGLSGHGKPKTPELSIWLKIAAHGNGYGKEAIIALKQWADRHLRYDYLTYPVDRANIPSRKIPEALGGEVFKEEQYPTPAGRVLDIVIYHILPTEGKET